ncbi:Cellulose synthase-like protein E6 [Ananas comosus]|uniref:Cellulose synthase-like protein E6 n=1 Tax=Ananas comosus TaxID=4615 RepID=A0A199VDC9_ANACO|nr:Cellulose synthase-like protein E6 [Ananas comosus]
MGSSSNSNGPLFVTEEAKGRGCYKVFASSMLVGILLIWFYRATHHTVILVGGGGGEEEEEEGMRWARIGLFMAELWFGFYWILTQSVRWNPIRRSTSKDKLAQRYGSDMPGVDIFVCTADPHAEPPSLVVSTVLSVMAYDYPPEKLNVYLSDDGGSVLTFYALWEAARFAKHWLPFCRKYNDLYEEMANRIDSAVTLGKIPEEVKAYHKGFSEWNFSISPKDHHPIVQIMIDGKDANAVDNTAVRLPTLVYMAREKRPQYHHNFKAGAMNALIRVSSVVSNSPIILNVDCDMYSNNSESIKDALCFFLDEERGQNIGYVQYPQNYNNITQSDLYGNSLTVINEVELPGLDYWGGPLYIGTGCFHRREILCGRRYSRDYTEDWRRGAQRQAGESVEKLEERAKPLATCTYELNTQWGNEIGLKYGCAVEDVITGLLIQCRGWKSIYFNPPRKGFLGVAPTTMAQTLLQHKRWSEGNLQIFLSKHCPFLLGHGKIRLGLQMGYGIYGLWGPNSFPTLYYVAVPSLALLRGISLFPKVTSLWFIPFTYVMVGRHIYSLVEALRCGCTFNGWWNGQRMWMIRRITSYLYGTIDTVVKMLGLSKMAFAITTKVSDEDASKRYEQDVMEFGYSSPMLVIISTVALLNIVCLVGGLFRLVLGWGVAAWDAYLIQVILCGMIVAINMPIYDALFFRKDKGNIPPSVTFTSLAFVLLLCAIPLM